MWTGRSPMVTPWNRVALTMLKRSHRNGGKPVQRYGNLSGESGVLAYEVSPGAIVVQFSNGWKYEYTERSAGAAAIADMHRLARAGRGLSGYISVHVRDAYKRKFQ